MFLRHINQFSKEAREAVAFPYMHLLVFQANIVEYLCADIYVDILIRKRPNTARSYKR